MVIIEGLIICFILLIACVVGISNGAVNLVCLYEKEVQDKVVEIGLITREKIKKIKYCFLYSECHLAGYSWYMRFTS